jgi:hypothetical protein
MAPRKSSDWLYIFPKGTDWLVAGGDCLENMISSLNDPHIQYPSTVLMVGGHERNAAQIEMFPCLDFSESRGLAQLRADPSTLDHDHPLLVASLDTENAYNKLQPPRSTFGNIRHRLEWLLPTTATETLVDTVVGRVLLLFTDVICIFLDDFPTPEEGFHLVQRWEEAAQTLPPWKPRVILVTSRGPVDKHMLSTPMFGEVRQVELRSRNSKQLRSQRYRRLERVIRQSVGIVQKRKFACKRLFSAIHFNAFFKLALQHAASRIPEGFNFILATRQLHEIDDRFVQYLETFLELCVASHVSRDTVLRYIASAIILDSLPPRMYRKCY